MYWSTNRSIYDEPDGSLSIIHLCLGSSFLEIFAYANNTSQPALELAPANNLEDTGVKHIAVATDDIQAGLEGLKRQGLAAPDTTITIGRTNVSYFFVKDPDGVWVEIVKDDRYDKNDRLPI